MLCNRLLFFNLVIDKYNIAFILKLFTGTRTSRVASLISGAKRVQIFVCVYISKEMSRTNQYLQKPLLWH